MAPDQASAKALVPATTPEDLRDIEAAWSFGETDDVAPVFEVVPPAGEVVAVDAFARAIPPVPPAPRPGIAPAPDRAPGRTSNGRTATSDADRADVLVTRTSRLDAIEQYRKLAAALHEGQKEHGIRTVLCTSALVEEGKTVTACNLALTLSASYNRRVLLIDGDLRRPQLHGVFGLGNETGLRDALTATQDGKLRIQNVNPNLAVLTAGSASSDPMGGLTSDRLRHVIAEASERFDWVIIDTPPVLILPDARVLVTMVDTVLLVVRAGTTPFRTVLRAVDVIKRERVFGVVLNRADTMEAGYGAYEYYAAPHTA
ncbi:MAG TPA: CpsD/CapB family tyrosine-protein kinase [Vicinamibacterales bacterium]|nr:CpsD/CapB family tyrosine-protein kinase [Vicinamibacterales bacterium]